MKKILFVIILLVFVFPLYANPLFRIEDNIYYVSYFGTGEIKNNFNLISKADFEGVIVKFDKNLQVEKFEKLDNLDVTGFFDAFVDNEGNIIVVGIAGKDSFGTGKLQNIKSFGGGDIILLKFDPNLKLLKIESYGSAYDDIVSKGILLKDGNFLICGIRSNSNSNKGFVAKFNNDFKCIKEFEFNEEILFNDIIETFDNSIIISGAKSINQEETPVLISFDNDLNVKKKSIDFDKNINKINKLYEIEKGYYALANSTDNNSYLLKLDKDFKIMDKKKFLPKYNNNTGSSNKFINIDYIDNKYLIVGTSIFDKDLSYYTFYSEDNGFENIKPLSNYIILDTLICFDNNIYSITYDKNDKLLLEKNIIEK